MTWVARPCPRSSPARHSLGLGRLGGEPEPVALAPLRPTTVASAAWPMRAACQRRQPAAALAMPPGPREAGVGPPLG
jgi:hypothetical protein